MDIIQGKIDSHQKFSVKNVEKKRYSLFLVTMNLGKNSVVKLMFWLDLEISFVIMLISHLRYPSTMYIEGKSRKKEIRNLEAKKFKKNINYQYRL